MAHEKFKAGAEDELRKSYLAPQHGFPNSLSRPILEELREG